MSDYFELRCAVMEMFYGTMLEEHYTVGQAADRCLVEFQLEVEGGGRTALTVLSCLLARVARHERKALAQFTREVEAARALEKAPACWKGLEKIERERMREDLRFIGIERT